MHPNTSRNFLKKSKIKILLLIFHFQKKNAKKCRPQWSSARSDPRHGRGGVMTRQKASTMRLVTPPTHSAEKALRSAFDALL